MLALLSVAALTVLVPTLAAPTSGGNIPFTKFAGPVQPDSYIVKLKDGVSKDSHLQSILSNFVAGSSLRYKYDIFNGYAVTLKSRDLDRIRQSKDVAYIAEDGIASIDDFSDHGFELSERSNQGVDVSPRSAATKTKCGAGVEIYHLDSGIYLGHEQFGGRARWGATFGNYSDIDDNGHGTHTAATAVGKTYGQAPEANIIAIKVLNRKGRGQNSDIIGGINWAYNAFKQGSRPAIVTMSISGSPDDAMDEAVRNAIAGGLHFTLSASNSDEDVSNRSPARVPTANTVGAVDGNKEKADFSNYGPLVDVQAPGVNILSAWIGSPDASRRLNGTSMSTPYVAGILAVAISEYGNKSPAELSADLKSHARPVVRGEPEGTTNLLATKWQRG
ncbi:subtilisin-like serine protease [Ceratobasidium sp. 428]|nr:subtilisin-like serine protease [Ceratobasidium sp. 428]